MRETSDSPAAFYLGALVNFGLQVLTTLPHTLLHERGGRVRQATAISLATTATATIATTTIGGRAVTQRGPPRLLLPDQRRELNPQHGSGIR
ncbi:hypothetical protein EYF80_055616 [Liparis tanakae]|uniref:Uncharacterized protein n=1 Tax=Liparis tanakae TaxID=230148 RepID=A0A4Z2F0P7_9TELE|nr:hypothetical protein EYF80_055616 [Liparis tanakae]